MTVAERVPGYLHPLLAGLADAPDDEPAFWGRMANERTPLIEPDPTSPGFSFVTYVFHDPDAVHVVFDDTRFPQEVSDFVMERIPGTGVWHTTYRYRNDVRAAYYFQPNMPLVSVNCDETEYVAFWEFLRRVPPKPDPNARETFVSCAGDGLPHNVASILSLPDAPDQSIIEERPDLVRGRVEEHVLKSEVLSNERRIWVYTPPGYVSDERAYPLIILFDGAAALSVMPTPRILDNLLADGRIALAVAVFIGNANDRSRSIELPCNVDFARFIETELIPWVRDRYGVSQDPEDAFVTGSSYGGLAALWLGSRLPHLIGNVISQSASLWWGPGVDLEKPPSLWRYTPEWLTDQFASAPRLPLRIWMEVGLMELEDRMVGTNRRMAAVLREKGYALTYSEFAAGHDWSHWRVSLAKALTLMLPPIR